MAFGPHRKRRAAGDAGDGIGYQPIHREPPQLIDFLSAQREAAESVCILKMPSGEEGRTEPISSPVSGTETRAGQNHSEEAPKTSAEIINEIITLRKEALWKSFNEEFIRVVRSDKQLQAAIRGLASMEYVEEPPGIRVPEGMALLDLLQKKPQGGFAHARAAALFLTNQIINGRLLPVLLRIQPSLTREQLVKYVKAAWPASRGPKSKILFDPRLVAEAHDAVLRETPHYDCRAACQVLADRLCVTARTIQFLRAQARRKN